MTITPADAGQNPVICTITNTRKTATLQLTKDWDSSPATADEVRLDLGTSGSLATANSAVDGSPNGTASAVVLVGETYPFSETFTSGDAANYNSSWTCDGAADTNGSGLSGSVAVTAADAGGTVACKFLNERKTMTLKLQKAWVNGHAGDTAAARASTASTTTAPPRPQRRRSAPSPTRRNVATVTAFAGETVTLNETVVPGANYNSSLACGAHAVTYSAGARTGSIAIAPADAATTVTCTYTNARKSRHAHGREDLERPGRRPDRDARRVRRSVGRPQRHDDLDLADQPGRPDRADDDDLRRRDDRRLRDVRRRRHGRHVQHDAVVRHAVDGRRNVVSGSIVRR